MKGGGAAVSISQDKRLELINSVQSKWDETVDDACGEDLAGDIRDLFAEHAP